MPKTNQETESACSKIVNGKQIKAEKRKKWEEKQDRKRKLQRKSSGHDEWISKHSNVALHINEGHVAAMKQGDNDDEVSNLLSPYNNLQDGKNNITSTERSKKVFIAEGTETVRLLIQRQEHFPDDDDPIQIQSILVKPSVLFEPPVQLLTDVEDALSRPNAGFRVLVGEESVLSHIAGFQGSRGAFACGYVPVHRDEAWLLNQIHLKQQKQQSVRLLALDGISDTANLGSMIRCASAFEVLAVVLSDNCCDAWYRRSIRVSMGHIFKVPCVRVGQLSSFLTTLRNSSLPIESYAAIIDPNADLILERMDRGTVGDSWCCVMGNESNGISDTVRRACSLTIRIDMDSSVDSLSVPIATGILLHGLREREKQRQCYGEDTGSKLLR